MKKMEYIKDNEDSINIETVSKWTKWINNLLMVAIIVLLGFILFENFGGYSDKFGIGIAFIFVAIEAAMMFAIIGMLTFRSHPSLKHKSIMWVMIITMMGLSTYGLYTKVWQEYSGKFITGDKATANIQSYENELNILSNELIVIRKDISNSKVKQESLTLSKQDLTEQYTKSSLDIKDIIYSVANCDKSKDCTTRKNIAVGIQTIIKDDISSKANEIILIVKEIDFLMANQSSKIAEISKLKSILSENQKLSQETEVSRNSMGGNAEWNEIFALVVSFAMYPIYIILLFLHEHLKTDNIIRRRKDRNTKASLIKDAALEKTRQAQIKFDNENHLDSLEKELISDFDLQYDAKDKIHDAQLKQEIVEHEDNIEREIMRHNDELIQKDKSHTDDLRHLTSAHKAKLEQEDKSHKAALKQEKIELNQELEQKRSKMKHREDNQKKRHLDMEGSLKLREDEADEINAQSLENINAAKIAEDSFNRKSQKADKVAKQHYDIIASKQQKIYQDEINKLEDEHQAEINKLSQASIDKITNLKLEKADLIRNHIITQAEETRKYKAELTSKDDQRLVDIQMEIDDNNTLKSNYSNQLNRILADNTNEIKRTNDNHLIEISSIHKNHLLEINSIHEKGRQLSENHLANSQKMAKEYSEEIQELQDKYSKLQEAYRASHSDVVNKFSALPNKITLWGGAILTGLGLILATSAGYIF